MPQTNFGAGASDWLRKLLEYGGRPFQPGGRLNLLPWDQSTGRTKLLPNGEYDPNWRGPGILDPMVPGSLGNSAWSLVGMPFGFNSGEEAYQDALQGLNYAGSPVKSAAARPVTGPALPKRPPTPIAPFSAGWQLTSVPGDARDGGARRHAGWDFAPTGGDPNIRAPRPFEVVSTSKGGKGGNIATVRFDDGSTYKMMHLAQLPPVGHRGAAGSVIAAAGRSGNATGTTVHVQPVGGAPDPTQLFGGGGGGRGGPHLQAFQQAAGAVGLNRAPPGFNGSGYQQADVLLQQVAGNQMRPFGATYQEQPLPPLPEPQPLQAPDTSKGDAAFAAAQPKNPFGATPEEQEKGKLRTRRGEYFSGMAAALGSIDWSRGVGLGELFAKLGAGAVMGASAGDKEVQAKLDKFDAAMQQYSMATANREDNKAVQAANIANQNIQGMNQHKRDLWQVQVKEIERTQPRVENGVLVTRTKNPDGTTTETHTPIDPARTTAVTMARANNAVAAQSAANEYSWQTYRMDRELAGAALPYAMADASASGQLQQRDGIFAVGLSEAAEAVTNTGRWRDLYANNMPQGGARAEAVQRQAWAAAGLQVNADGTLAPGQKPNEAQQELMNNYISSQVITDFVNGGRTWALVGGESEDKTKPGSRRYRAPTAEVQASVATRREAERKVRRTVDSKGRTTTSESF